MTIKDIARLAGVSISTVSKIINEKDEHISPQTRTRVLQIVKEYNFTPYAIAKSSPDTKKFLLGVLLHSSCASASLLSGILQTAQEHGYGILLLESKGDPLQEAKHISSFCRNGIDGLLWEPSSAEISSHCNNLKRQKIPYFFLGNTVHSPAFQIDFSQLGYYLAESLIRKNHSAIACFPSENSQHSVHFQKGFCKCLYDHQISCPEHLLLHKFDESFLHKISQYNITAAACADLKTARALYRSLRRQHYEIPSDFSVVSLNDNNNTDENSPISSLMIPYHEFGQHVCRELISICEKSSQDRPTYIFSPACGLNHESSIDCPAFMQEKFFISVGSIHKDITFNVNAVPQLGSTLKIRNSATSIGGKGTNQAVGVAKLGHAVHLIGAVGNDFDAAFILNMLEKENVSTQGIFRNKKTKSGKAYIYAENSGESAITVLSGANDYLTPENIQNSEYLFKNACYCLISGEIPLDTVILAAQVAKNHHVTTIFKPSTLEALPEDLYQTVDILVPNRKEASVLCPDCISVEEQADFFYSKGFPIVIITLGHEGCYLKTADICQYFPAVEMKVCDTTGGADAFISALASYLHTGYSLTRSIQIAMYASAFCIARQGVTSALIDKNSLELYIGRTQPELLTDRN